MDQTTRAMAILAASVLILAPLVNGVLEEAAATADRIFLKETDWTGDPPDDPPETPPPEELNQTDLEGNFSGAGVQPQCSPEERWGPRWLHPPLDQNPTVGATNRSNDDTSASFTIGEGGVAFGVALNATNVRGQFSAYVYEEGQSGNPVFSVEKNNPFGEDLHRRSVTTRSQLTEGTWIAEVNHRTAHYDALQFAIRIAFCPEAST